ncbi:NECAB3 isoform 17 [Pongo abelii]|uniref:NECAB3 isoform 17 n=1 Tax=Pongo abelii TaxID=9601 RepID=A0A2J8VIU9_PONAB|nr:NECAB3 isoform 17 [Pongo abelii]
MACAGLLTVCLLRPPAPQPQPQTPRHPQLAPDPGPAGHTLFQDVFHRADKNELLCRWGSQPGGAAGTVQRH